MKFVRDLLSENGNISCMRLMSVVCCLAAVAIAIVGINKPAPDYSGLSILISAFLTAAMGGKIMQKRIEVDGAKSDVEVEKK